MGQLYTPKNTNFAILVAVSPHFKATAVKFDVKVQTWETLPQSKFCKNRLRGIPLLGKFIPKITNFGDFGGCKPTF